MIGKIFITRSGYDPQKGKHVKDPYLGNIPSLGACRPDIRRTLKSGDHVFVISGKVKGVNQFVMAGFEVDEKMHMLEAYHRYPEQRLAMRVDGQPTGNIILDANGMQHTMDDHSKFESRLDNYVIGKNPIILTADSEIERGRDETLPALREILKKDGKRPIDVIGRGCCKVDENQIADLRSWLATLKAVH